jgi:hypothetical protein
MGGDDERMRVGGIWFKVGRWGKLERRRIGFFMRMCIKDGIKVVKEDFRGEGVRDK